MLRISIEFRCGVRVYAIAYSEHFMQLGIAADLATVVDLEEQYGTWICKKWLSL